MPSAETAEAPELDAKGGPDINQTAKDLSSGAAGGIAQVLIGRAEQDFSSMLFGRL